MIDRKMSLPTPEELIIQKLQEKRSLGQLKQRVGPLIIKIYSKETYTTPVTQHSRSNAKSFRTSLKPAGNGNAV